jgi:hypothetical protein
MANQHTDMDVLADYYLLQGDGGNGHQAVCSDPCTLAVYVQPGHGIGSFLAGLFRAVEPVAI